MAAKSGYMPNNPDNVESFTDGDRVVHRGMYGLEVRINDPTLPKVATPDQQGISAAGLGSAPKC